MGKRFAFDRAAAMRTAWVKRMGTYRTDVLTNPNYTADEPIEPDWPT